MVRAAAPETEISGAVVSAGVGLGVGVGVGVGVGAEFEPPPPPPQAVRTNDIKPIRMGCLKTADNLIGFFNE
jgi:hypothetical protein